MTLTNYSLPALRTFEVAARHLSFTKAAEELFLTRSAVSQQISQLERQVGVQLFHRVNSRLILSREGNLLANAVRKSLMSIESALDNIRSGDVSGRLVIGSLPSFGAKWLTPHLNDFSIQYPKVEILLLSYVSLDDVISNGVDVAISFARERRPGICQEVLLQDQIWPICSPSLLQGRRPILSVEDLSEFPILHTTLEALDFGSSWEEWLAALQLPSLVVPRTISFSRAYMMIEAAMRGLGVGISMRSLVEDDVNNSRLVRLFDYQVDASKLLTLFYPEAAEHRPAIRAFSSWLHEKLGAGPTIAARR